MCRRMKRQKFEKRKYLSSFGVAFVCAPTPLHFDPSEWNWMLYFCACHWERTDSHLMDVIPIETSMGIAVSESAQIKNTFHWNLSQFLRSSTSFCCCFFGFLFCHFYSSCLHSLDLQRLKRRTQSNAIYNDEMNQKICAQFSSRISIEAGARAKWKINQGTERRKIK